MNNPPAAQRRRVIAAAGICLVAVFASLLLGGVPLVLGLGAGAFAVAVAMPGAPRRYLFRRLGGILISVALAMWFMWLLAHNYPDASRLDEPGVIPAFARYIDWIGGLVAGDLGYSQYSETVWEGISRTIPLSLQLLIYSQVLAVGLAVPGALVGARFRGRIADVVSRAIGLLGLATPIIIIGPILVFLFAVGSIGIFGLDFGWKILPAGRYVPFGDGVVDHIKSMLLPSVTLALTTAASYMVVLRSEVILQLRQDHARLADVTTDHLVLRQEVAVNPDHPDIRDLSLADLDDDVDLVGGGTVYREQADARIQVTKCSIGRLQLGLGPPADVRHVSIARFQLHQGLQLARREDLE